MTNLELAIQLFLQLSVILVACRGIGWLGRRLLGQTQVVMEMVVGVLLGPSFLGFVAPGLQEQLFPRVLKLVADGGEVVVRHPSMAVLFALSQLGLVLYMFLIGLEFDGAKLHGRLGTAGLISGAGIVTPFVLGGGLALLLLRRGDLFGSGVTPLAAFLYLGASMSITAFPMLARILQERGMAGTRLGTMALAAGSLDDAIAWCLLALVLATLRETPALAILAIGGGLAYCLVMLTAGRRALAVLGRRFEARGHLSVDGYTTVMLVLMLCALVTDAVGIYAVFGAFVCGAAMPRGGFAEQVRRYTEPLTVTVLLPIFFVYSGLNTYLGLVDTPSLWWITLAVIVVAMAGKGLACTLAARLGGETWRGAATLGTLMNARGLMELIILNVGLENGVITPTLFTIMVLMAVITTLLASPLFHWLVRDGRLGAV